MIRFDSLKDLHDKLAEIELLKNKIQLCNDEIVINFHKDFVLEIKLKDFSVYILTVYYIIILKNKIFGKAYTKLLMRKLFLLNQMAYLSVKL